MSGRKVRADFNKTRDYSVNVEKCTEREKEEVQQAFFDVGIYWRNKLHGVKYMHLDAVKYTNMTCNGLVTRNCMYASSTIGCNMTAKEFLELVYEPMPKGHVHAELMRQYAKDAKTNPEPWNLWQFKDLYGSWVNCAGSPEWCSLTEYRRKTKTHTVHGVEIPDLRIEPKIGEWYYLVDLTSREFTCSYRAIVDSSVSLRVSRGLCYEPTEGGKQAAILHSKVLLGIA